MLELFENIGRAIADPSRVRILKLLQHGELCVCQITVIVGLSSATTSKHLSILRGAGLLSQRKSGRWVYYSLSAKDSNPYARQTLELIERILDDDATVGNDRERLEHISRIPVREVIEKGHRVFDRLRSERAV